LDAGKNPPQLLSKKAVVSTAAILLSNLTDIIVFSALRLDADAIRFAKSVRNV
jgi:uncharacterized PurR-regulated membrane protein YhhQ (DUF165 family)